MAAADTAKLLASLDLQDNMSPKLRGAVGGISQAENRVGSLSSKLSGFASNLKGNVGNALSTFGGRVRQMGIGLAAGLGIGGLLSFTGALKSSLGKAQEWGLQIEKLQGITKDSATALSGLLAVTEKYGLANERLSQIAGFTEKTLGKLTQTTKTSAQMHDKLARATLAVRVAQAALNKLVAEGVTTGLRYRAALLRVKTAQDNLAALGKGGNAADFFKTYGFSILDAQGKVKSFSQLLLTFSDYWLKNKNRAQAAAAAAKLFGRGYADLVPVLNLGSKGIKEAEAQAAALGLTLTQDNVVALAKAREATRQWGDAVGGLELQIGLTLLPTLSDLATAATNFVSSHRTDIVTFFHNAAEAAKTAVGTIGGLVGVVSTFWNSIPEGLRDLLLKGLIADRTIKFLFGISPIQLVAKLGEEALGGVTRAVVGGLVGAGIGKAFVQPVFVTNPGFGAGGGGGLPAVPAAAAGGLGLGTLLVSAFAIPAAILFANTLKTAAGITDVQQQRLNTTGQFGPRTAQGMAKVNVVNTVNTVDNSPTARDERAAAIKSALANARTAEHTEALNSGMNAKQEALIRKQEAANRKLERIADKRESFNISTFVRTIVPISVTGTRTYRISTFSKEASTTIHAGAT